MLFLLYILIRAHLEGVVINDFDSFKYYFNAINDEKSAMIGLAVLAFLAICFFKKKSIDQFTFAGYTFISVILYIISGVIITFIIYNIAPQKLREYKIDYHPHIWSEITISTMIWIHTIFWMFLTLLLIFIIGRKKGVSYLDCFMYYFEFEATIVIFVLMGILVVMLLAGILIIPFMLLCGESGGGRYYAKSKEEDERRELEDREIELALIAEMLNKDDD